MKNFAHLYTIFFSLLLLGLVPEVEAQDPSIYVRVWADGAMDGGDCSDCIGLVWGVDPRITVRFKIGNSTGGGGSWGSQYTTGYGDQGCDNWDDFNSNNPITSGLGNTTYGQYVHVQMTGYESDGFTCSADDGNCGGINWPTYNYSAGGGNHRQINGYAGGTCANGDYQSNRNNCSSDNSTNDYKIRYCYDFYFTNASNIAAPLIQGTNSTQCTNWDPPLLYSTAPTGSWRDRQWQYNYNGGGWTNISGATGANYNPPALTSTGTHQYRVYYRYAAAFSTSSSFHYKYSSTVTFTINNCPEQGFGNCFWNVNCYSGRDLNLGVTTFQGYYTETANTYDSRNRWPAAGSPQVASGYTGLPLGSDNHTVVSKRQCFPCGYYNVQVRHDDEYRLYIDGNQEAANTGTGDPTGTVWTGLLDASSTIEMRHAEGGGSSYQGVILNKIDYPDPGFGNNIWNVVAYSGSDYNLGAGVVREGYYTENNLSFNTSTRWGNLSTPFLANTSSGDAYIGCDPGVDNHTIVSKRQGFDCKYYNLLVSHDDYVKLFIDGLQVFEYNASCCGTDRDAWSGVLGATSTVELRTQEGSSASYQGINFVEIADPVAAVNQSILCVGADGVDLSFTGASLGGNRPFIFSKWQIQVGSTGGTWVDLSTSLNYTYYAPSYVGQTIYFRAEYSAAGCTKYSNIASVIVDDDITPPTTTAPAPQTIYNSPLNNCKGAMIFDDPTVVEVPGNCSGTASGTENIVPSSGLVLWTRADAGVEKDASNRVSEWADLSGSDNDMAQNTVAYWPTYVANAINGHPVIRFNTSSFITTEENFSSTNYTIITVSQMQAGANFRLISSASTNWLQGYHAGTQDDMYANGWVLNGGTATDINVPHLYTTTGNGSITTFYENGTQLAANGIGVSPPGRLQLNGYNNGLTEVSTGDVAEVLIYDRVLTQDERERVEGYLAYKYNLQVPFASMQEAQTYSAGSHTINFQGADNAGNIANVSNNLTVNTYPGPAISASPTTACAAGTVTLTATGMAPSGQALNNSASGHYLQPASNPVIGAIWTLETWFKYPLANTGSWNTLVRGTSNHHVIVQRSNMQLGVYVGGFQTSGFDMSQLSSGWHHMAAIGAGGTTYFFIDGVQVGYSNAQATDNIVAIGNYQGGGQQFGQIDEFRIWNTVLYPIKTINDYMTQNITASHPYWGNMVAYYKMDGNGNDSKGSNNGSLAGGVGFVNTDFYNYTWSGPGGVSFSNQNNTSETTVVSNPATGSYSVYASANGCNSTSNSTSVTIDPVPVGTTITSSNQICLNTTATFTSSISPGSFVRYQYQWDGTGGIWTDWSTNAIHNWTPTNAANAGRTLYVRTVMTNGTCADFYTTPVSVLIDAPSDLGTLNDAGPVEICDNAGNVPQISVSGNVGSITWDWGEPNGTWHNDWIFGANAGTCCFPVNTGAANAGADRFRYRVTNGVCPEVTSATILIENQNSPPPSSITASETEVCAGGAGNITLTANFLYQTNSTANVISDYSQVEFFSGSCGGTSLGTTAHTGGVAQLVIPAPGSTTTYYARSTSSCETSTCASASVTVTVVPDPTISIVQGPVIQVCTGGSTTLNALPSGGSNSFNYQWEMSTTSAIAGFSDIGGATTLTYNTPALTQTTWYRVRNNDTGPGCADPVSTAVEVNVKADPTISIVEGPLIQACTGGSITLNALPTGGSDFFNYQWEMSTTSASSGFSDIGGANTLTYTTPALTQTTWYRVRNDDTAPGCADPVSAVVEVNIKADPTISIVEGPQDICVGENVTLNALPSGGSDFFNYQWEMSTTSAIAGFSDIGGATTLTYNTPALTQTTWYRVRNDDTAPGCADPVSAAVQVTVHPDNTVAPTSVTGPTAICPQAVTLTAVGGSLGTNINGVYEWDDNPSFSSPATTVVPNYTTPVINANTTYYVRISSDCSTTASQSITITITAPSSLVYLIQNGDPNGFDGSTLDKICEESGWTYYTVNGIDDKYVFAINWDPLTVGGGHNSAAKAAAVPRVNVDATYTSAISTPVSQCYATFAMARYWNVDVGGNSLDGPVVVRFYYDATEVSDILAARNSHALANSCPIEGGFEWFKTQTTDYNPASDVTPISIRDGIYVYDLNITSATENGVLYADLLVNSFSGGSGATGTGDRNDPLPVELVTFTATALDNAIRLDWTTLSEVNNDKFEVLKSFDGINFVKIGEVDGNGNSIEPISYSYDDSDVERGILYYYRLNQVDFDGTGELSTIVSAMLDLRDEVVIGELIPNPTVNVSYIDITLPRRTEMNVIVTNMLGQEVIVTGNFEMSAGNQRLEIDASTLSKGNYLVSIQIKDGFNYLRKMIVIE